MLRKLFGKEKKKSEVVVLSPMTGTIMPIEEVPDPTFAQKMIGDGIAIDPTEGVVVAPIDGEIVQLFPTKHAIGIVSKSGLEILIHIGIETVSMDGEGFEAYVKQGDQVKVGDRLIQFDLNLVKEKAASTISPVVITNGDIVESFEKGSKGHVDKGQSEIGTISVKNG